MAAPVVRAGDMIVVVPPPGVLIAPGQIPLKGTGAVLVGGLPACTPLDVEGMPPIPCNYSKPGFVGGLGTLRFKLLPLHYSRALTRGQPVVVDPGAGFLFTFVLVKPAQTPNGFPDPLPPLAGTARFQRKPMPRPVQA
ncbi:hypothetical protein ACIRS1_05550 [Kitasatospora sp. NPDC101176]|uniref:hypothetical protein n=1 Tax=Kitasatospora sp. NPDC101176 TaxID=3364099 RepID=UPI00382028B3